MAKDNPRQQKVKKYSKLTENGTKIIKFKAKKWLVTTKDGRKIIESRNNNLYIIKNESNKKLPKAIKMVDGKIPNQQSIVNCKK